MIPNARAQLLVDWLEGFVEWGEPKLEFECVGFEECVL